MISSETLVERQGAHGDTSDIIEAEDVGRLARARRKVLITSSVLTPEMLFHLLVAVAFHVARHCIGCDQCSSWTIT